MSAESWIGKSIGTNSRYEIKELIGKGGMGVVYLAQDWNMEQSVVVKVPLVELLGQAEFRHRFQREVRSLVELSHPHVVRILDVGEHENVPFAVMQYLAGGSLADRINGEEFAPSLTLLPHWLPSIARAIDFIHGRGYVHRDVKPANILFDEKRNAYISDFGVVKVTSEARLTKGITNTGLTLGTVEYMAPELLLGEPFDGRADQYALAATIYECLAGRLPFEKSTPAAIIVEKVSKELPPLHEMQDDASLALSMGVQRAMSRAASHRFDNCQTFADAILAADHLVTGSNGNEVHPVSTETEEPPGGGDPPKSEGRRSLQSVLSHARGLGEHLTERIRRHPSGLGIAATLMLIAIIVGVALRDSESTEPDPPPPIPLKLTVREGSPVGPLAVGAKVTVYRLAEDGGGRTSVATGTTDRDGEVSLRVTDDSASGTRTYRAKIMLGGAEKEVSLADFPQLRDIKVVGPIPLPPPLPTVPLQMTVHEGSHVGPLAVGAKVTVYRVAEDGGGRTAVANGTTDRYGQVSLRVTDLSASGKGSYRAKIMLGGAEKEVPLAAFPRSQEIEVAGPIAPPQRLLNAHLKCEFGWSIEVIPLGCLGVDVVNTAGKSAHPDDSIDDLHVQYLPGAVIYLRLIPDDNEDESKFSQELFLSLTAEDDRKTLKLRVDWPLVYKGDHICWIGLDDAHSDISSARQLDESSKASRLEARLRTALTKVKQAYDSGELSRSCNGQFTTDTEDLKLVRSLEDSGIGLVFAFGSIPANSIYAAIEAVKPTKILLPTSMLKRARPNLENVETLLVAFDGEAAITALPDLPKLRHLALAGEEAVIDLDVIRNPRQLQSLYVFGKQVRNIELCRHMAKLQFLINYSETAIPKTSLCGMPRTQYLLSFFPSHYDMSFVESMPHLQTLVMNGLTSSHDLRPLEKARDLRCLALIVPNDGHQEALQYSNITSLRKARPDITIVPYEGICLGSWWLVPAALLALIGAWLLRRHRSLVGGRP